MGSKKKNSFYAYLVDGESGIVDSWDECSRLTSGKVGARYKGFPTEEEAEEWLEGGAQYQDKGAWKAEEVAKLDEDAVYFDAGTGSGVTEVRVTDREGTPLLHLALDKAIITRQGNYRLPGRTNNYGELYAMNMALRVALKLGAKRICGDSKLVIEFWSKGHIKRMLTESDPKLAELVEEVKEAREEFEAQGGEIERISGHINPADLGYHRF